MTISHVRVSASRKYCFHHSIMQTIDANIIIGSSAAADDVETIGIDAERA